MKLPWLHTPVTFERYMRFCLYDPEQGYYRKGNGIFGREGDFFTSPHTHPVFAQTLASYFNHTFQRMGTPRPFSIIELGAGDGRLAEDLLPCIEGEFPRLFSSLRYVPVEAGRGDLPGSFCGVVFSNELFDALPVHRVICRGEGLNELYVLFDGEEIHELEQELSSFRLKRYMQEGFQTWQDGSIYEVNLEMIDTLQRLDAHLESGVVLTIDYGYDLSEYDSAERSKGTLMCYSQHTTSHDPYLNPTRQDITAHVNFHMMKETGKSLGWTHTDLQSQRDFLMRWGLERRLLEQERSGWFDAASLEERLGLKDLLTPGGISDTLRVLIQEVRLK